MLEATRGGPVRAELVLLGAGPRRPRARRARRALRAGRSAPRSTTCSPPSKRRARCAPPGAPAAGEIRFPYPDLRARASTRSSLTWSARSSSASCCCSRPRPAAARPRPCSRLRCASRSRRAGVWSCSPPARSSSTPSWTRCACWPASKAPSTPGSQPGRLRLATRLRAKARMCASGDLLCHETICAYASAYAEKRARRDLVARCFDARGSRAARRRVRARGRGSRLPLRAAARRDARGARHGVRPQLRDRSARAPRPELRDPGAAPRDDLRDRRGPPAARARARRALADARRTRACALRSRPARSEAAPCIASCASWPRALAARLRATADRRGCPARARLDSARAARATRSASWRAPSQSWRCARPACSAGPRPGRSRRCSHWRSSSSASSPRLRRRAGLRLAGGLRDAGEPSSSATAATRRRALGACSAGCHAVVGCSATLSPPELYAASFGLSARAPRPRRASRPRTAARAARVVIDAGVSTTREAARTREAPRIARRLAALCEAVPGNCLALFPSHALPRAGAAAAARAARAACCAQARGDGELERSRMVDELRRGATCSCSRWPAAGSPRAWTMRARGSARWR